MTTQRERFEAFAKDQGWSVKRWKENGKRARAYQHVTVRAAWLAWQEAERQMKERCAEVCKGIADSYSEQERYIVQELRTPPEDAATDCESAIRALGDDDAAG